MIGTKARWMTGALVSAGLLVGSIGAADARPRYGYDRGWNGGWDRHHRHRGDGFGLGDAIGVAALVGAVAIVASSISKNKKIRDPRTGGEYDAPPRSPDTDYGADARTGTLPPDAPIRDDADFSDVASANAQDDAMTDACAVAAREEAQGQDGGYAEIRSMDQPRTSQDGATNIDGEIETRASYRATDGTTRRFTCTMRDGRVAQVYISRDVALH